MTEYMSCMGSSGKDPREKYEIKSNLINIYRKPDKSFTIFRKWALAESFVFSDKTEVRINHEKDHGSGRVFLVNTDGSNYDFFVYGNYKGFISDLSKSGLKISF